MKANYSLFFLCILIGSSISILTLPNRSNAASSFYVSPRGSGSVCSRSNTCSLATGISTARAGDQVVLTDGEYSGSYFTKSDGVVIRAENLRKAILRNATETRLLTIRHSAITVLGLHFDGGGVSKLLTIKKDGSDFVIENNIFENSTRAGFSVGGNSNVNGVIIRHNLIRNTGLSGPGEGIYIGSPHPELGGLIQDL